HEWSGGANVSWGWHSGEVFQAGYTVRNPHQDAFSQSYTAGLPNIPFSEHLSNVRQDVYAQQSAQLWKNRIRLAGGIRWAKLTGLYDQPITGQASIAFQAAQNTTIEAGWGRYA